MNKKRNFRELLRAQWDKGNFVCIGLDSELGKIPESARVHMFSSIDTDVEATMVNFNIKIVEATKELVCAYKPNLAFYIAHGDTGIRALRRTIEFIHDNAPDIPVILDAKFADIGNTNNGYVQFAFEYLGADAVTVNPYLGREALQPFLDCKDKGIIVLCCTSNPGGGEFQNLKVVVDNPRPPGLCMECDTGYSLVPLYQHIAKNVTERWNENDNCLLVVGATYPKELAEVRAIVRDMPILIPGVGAQGGDVEETVKAGKDSCNQGMIINSSRSIIFPASGDPRGETLKLRNLINQNLNH
jgi:orotidine-5'-phosphate decarboxylase